MQLLPKSPHEIEVERRSWRGRKVAVWGAARTGVAAARLLDQLGAQVTLSDPKNIEDLDEIQSLPPTIRLSLGHTNEIGDAELIIPSPGLKPNHRLIRKAQAAGVPLMSEVELAARVTAAPIIAITGTDGKSTTTLLITEVLRAQEIWAQPVGNIGDPISNWALNAPEDGVLVLEISAFQLWSTQTLNAQIGVITNIVDDHLDYFDGSAQAYRAAKVKLAQLLSSRAPLFYPPSVLSLPEIESAQTQGALDIQLCAYDRPHPPLESGLIGDHNQLNIGAALTILEALHLDLERAQARLRTFTALPYRLTLSRELEGVRYLNDSKATNVHAACTGLSSLSGVLIVIVGGYEKGLELTELIRVLASRARVVLTIGQTGPRIGDALAIYDVTCISCDRLEVAVSEAHRRARAGETVVFSPAASSFDQFESYEARGATFDLLVRQLHSKL